MTYYDALRPDGISMRIGQVLSGRSIKRPYTKSTKFVPPQLWLVSDAMAAPSAHLVDWAVAVWDGDQPYFGARGRCGAQVLRARFVDEPPGDVFCDSCLLRDYVPPVVVYRIFDIRGRLLYVGCSVNLLARIGWHRANQDWWPDVASVTSVEFDTQVDALAVEREAIRTERPLYNRSTRATAPLSTRSRALATA